MMFLWDGTQPVVRPYSVTVTLRPVDRNGSEWCLSTVYGPTLRAEKEAFLAEIRDIRAACPGPWLVCGDFNIIYQAADKNNGRLHRRLMRAFRRVIDDLELVDLHLSGRSFTWSNERDRPTLERLDRALASVTWLDEHPNHALRTLSSDSSDHAPLLLVLNTEPWAPPRFRFHNFWTKMEGFLDVVKTAWAAGSADDVDACRSIDHKLRYAARCLQSWNASRVGSIRLQLAVARVVIQELDFAQEHRPLSQDELALRRELKSKTLGLASLNRTMARQRARTRFLKEGDACTRFFHLQACHRRRKNFLAAVQHNGQTFTEDEAKEGLVYPGDAIQQGAHN
jgi:hypothetical protein